MNEKQVPETIPTEPTITSRFRYKSRLISKSKVKALALDIAKSELGPERAKMITRVGSSFYTACEVRLAEFIRNRVKSQSSKGKTLI